MVWSTSIGQLRLPVQIPQATCLAPSQLLHTCSLAEYGKLEKVLDFIATTKQTSVMNIILLLNLKHGSYWEGN